LKIMSSIARVAILTGICHLLSTSPNASSSRFLRNID
jgi:hypothetical protein